MTVLQEDYNALRDMVLDLQQQLPNQSVTIQGGQPQPAEPQQKAFF